MILDGLICSHYSFDHWQVATTKTTGMSAFRQALKPLHTLPISLTTLVCLSMHTHNHHTPAHRRGEVFTFSLGTPNTVNADATFEKTQKQTKLLHSFAGPTKTSFHPFTDAFFSGKVFKPTQK